MVGEVLRIDGKKGKIRNPFTGVLHLYDQLATAVSFNYHLTGKTKMYDKYQTGNVLAWIYIGTSLYFGVQATKKRDELLEYLEADSLNLKTHQDFLAGLNKLKGLGNADLAPVYRRVLEILINNPDDPQVIDLVHKSGQWYFNSQEPAKVYTLDELLQVQTLLIKKREIESLITKLENGSEENFIEASKWIDRLDFSEFEDNAVKSRLLNLRQEFLEKFSTSLLRRITDNPTNKEFHSLLKSTLELINRPDSSAYEAFLISLLNHVVADPRDRDLKEFLMHSLDKAPGIAGVSSLTLYNTVLDLFEDSSSQKALGVLVLDIGRWHFSRKNWLRRSPKPEDELQMQNDISMRLKN